MTRRRRALTWAAVAVVLLALLALLLVPVAITRSLSPERVASMASQSLDREVRIRDLGLHFVPMPRVRLEGVWVAPGIELGSLDVALSPAALLQLRLEVARIEASDLDLSLIRRGDGSFGLAEDVDGASGGSGVPSLPERLPEIVLTSSRLELLDHALGGECVVGRHPSATFVLDDQLVSRKHFRVVSEGGVWLLEDLGSTNGTLVNGQRTSRQPLIDGDVIQAGSTAFRPSSGSTTARSWSAKKP